MALLNTFISQDTVVALQALSLYATKVFSSDGSSTVTVRSAGDTLHFNVNQDNKLLYQEKQLQKLPATYSIEVKGSTCVSVQVCSAFSFIYSHSLSFLEFWLFCCEMIYECVFLCVDSLRWLSSTTFPLQLKLKHLALMLRLREIAKHWDKISF